MADTAALEGLDPYGLQDAECARLAAWFGGLEGDGWDVPSACEGWNRRDLLAHLVAVEEYFTACLDHTVADLMQRYAETGVTSLDGFNAAGVAASEGLTAEELLDRWLAANAANRSGFRAADGTDIDSSVGSYPGRLQAFHVAFEYAIHANDVDAPVTDDERDGRQSWLAAVATFALTETKPTVAVSADGDQITVTDGATTTTLGREEFVAGASGRAEIGEPAASLLDLGY